MVANFLGLPPGFNEAWPWIVALDAWDYCDSAPLDHLLRGAAPIPDEIRPALADIVGGTRQPNKRAAAKLKLPAAERMKIAGSVSCILGLLDVFRRNNRQIADDKGLEQKELLAELSQEAHHAIATAAAELGVSVETVENLLRDLRKKIENWPRV